jgi:hypothetical protein
MNQRELRSKYKPKDIYFFHCNKCDEGLNFLHLQKCPYCQAQNYFYEEALQVSAQDYVDCLTELLELGMIFVYPEDYDDAVKVASKRNSRKRSVEKDKLVVNEPKNVKSN